MDEAREEIVRNARSCGICQAPADKHPYGFQCTANPGHVGDLFVGIFSDLSRGDEEAREREQVRP